MSEEKIELKENEVIKKIHRELTPEEYTALKESIRERGLEKPIDVMADGKTILDGHHRYKAMKELGRDITRDKIIVHPEIDTIEKAVLFAYDSEIRRHQRPFERCESIYNLYKKFPQLVVKSQRKGERIDEILARKAQVGQQLFSRAKKIIEHGSEILKRQVREGRISINRAYNEIKNSEIAQKGFNIRYVSRGFDRTTQVFVRHGRIYAYTSATGIYCCGCGLRVHSERELIQHLSRWVEEHGQPIDNHFKEWFKTDISRYHRVETEESKE